MDNTRTQHGYRSEQRDSDRSRFDYDDLRPQRRGHPARKDENWQASPYRQDERGPRYDDSYGRETQSGYRYGTQGPRRWRDEWNRDDASWREDRDDDDYRGQSARSYDSSPRPSQASYRHDSSWNRDPQRREEQRYDSPQQQRDWNEDDTHYRGYYRRSSQPYSYQGGSGTFVSESWSMYGPYSGKGPKGYKRSDEQICEEANQRLKRHGHLDACEIEVSCSNGNLTLKGKVEDRRAKREAQECVDDIHGVNDVMNELKVDKGFFEKLFSSNRDEKASSQTHQKNS
jgi:osmotically-inducible protein OsmY